MLHIKKFNEAKRWWKRNSSEDTTFNRAINQDDQELAEIIFKELENKIEPNKIIPVNYHSTLLSYEFNGDKFEISPILLKINGFKLECSKTIVHKFYKLFVDSKSEYDKDDEKTNTKNVRDYLKNKYKNR